MRPRLLLGLLVLSIAMPALADRDTPPVGLSPASPEVDVGIQPLGVPSGVISAVMSRDRILRQALESLGTPPRFHAFWRGADIVPLLADRRLEAGLLGDVPTLMASARGQAVIVGLVKQTSTAIVGRRVAQVSDLAGRRIGYVEGSSAHHTLLQGLRSAGLSERQVRLVPLAVSEMPEALERGEIDAFAAWEPAPSAALAANRANRIVFRGLTSDFLVLDRRFAEQQPAAARHLIAGFVRALEWMRRAQANLDRAVSWARLDAQTLSGKAPPISDRQIARITHEEILDVPSAPAIPGRSTSPPLRKEFDFLAGQGKLPPEARWDAIADALRYDGLYQVLAEPRRFRLAEFDYAD